MTQPKTGSKFTPGPWHVRLDEPTSDYTIRSDHQQIASSATMASYLGCVIADMLPSLGGFSREHALDEVKANARLIAASPTLYEYAKQRADAGDQQAKKMLDSLGLSD